ncbi:ROK family protein [Saccharopolyspora sp. CA-218241]|uniref:ROK family protein n=1 Tax=Saccharopolyspora sp. CA-218241 TaxID=3240027 RepID=UPI003D994F27
MTTHVIAVDVGGTEMKAALVAVEPGTATPLREIRQPTPRGDGPILDAVRGLVESLRGGVELAAAGVVVPGVVDERTGVGIYSANLGWRDLPIRDRLAEQLDVPVILGHDVRAGGLAEARLGAARGLRDVAVLPIGTGIAAALILGGALHTGGGRAGELGHVDVGHGERCGCGRTGCLEAVASSAAIARRYRARSGEPAAGGAEVVAALRDGDPHAAAVWQDAVDGLARGLIVLAGVVAPECVVLGGGLARAGGLLVEPLTARIDELLAPHHRKPRLELAELGDTAGCLGAALLATEGLTTA